jgi:hypothetical protein
VRERFIMGIILQKRGVGVKPHNPLGHKDLRKIREITP